MRVTKALVEHIVDCESNKKFSKAISKMEAYIDNWAEKKTRGQIDTLILKAWDAAEGKQREFFRTTMSYVIEATSCPSRYSTFSNPLPCTNHRHRLVPSEKIKEAVKLLDEAHSEMMRYQQELWAGISAYKGKSVSRMTEDIPELKIYVKEKLTNALIPRDLIKRTRSLLEAKANGKEES